MNNKNDDYSSGEDPFTNLHAGREFGIAVRLGDKISRLHTAARRRYFAQMVQKHEGGPEAQVFNTPDESELDTCLDIMNYAVLYYSYLHRRNTRNELSQETRPGGAQGS